MTAIMVAAGILGTTTSAGALTTPSCAASFIGVPGSGETSTSSAEMVAVRTSVTQDANAAGQSLRHADILSYPAVPWYRYAAGKLNLPWNTLGASEATGEKNLIAAINSDHAQNQAAGCADASILLAGYSQGAEVVVRTVDALSPALRKTVAVALLGNPSFTPNVHGDLNLNTIAYRGIRPSLISQKYTLTPDVIARTTDICAASDPICAFHLSVLPGLAWPYSSAHYHYTSLTYQGLSLTHLAGNKLWAQRYIPSVAPPSPPASHPVFTVMNTSETLPDGVWFRNSPHQSDTNRVTGHGVYAGDRVQLNCYAFGDAVGLDRPQFGGHETS